MNEEVNSFWKLLSEGKVLFAFAIPFLAAYGWCIRLHVGFRQDRSDIKKIKDLPCVSQDDCRERMSYCHRYYDSEFGHGNDRFDKIETMIKANKDEFFAALEKQEQRQAERDRQLVCDIVAQIKQ